MPRRSTTFIAPFVFRPSRPRSVARRGLRSVARRGLRSSAMPPPQPAPAPAPTESTPLIAPSQPPAPTREDGIRWRETWDFTVPYVIPQTLGLKLVAICSVICVIIRKGAALLPPYAYKLAVDALTSNLLPGSQGIVVPYAAVGLYISGRLVANFFGGIQDYTYAVVAAGCTRRFAVAMFAHLQNLSLNFHLSRKTGEMTRIMDRGTTSIETMVNTVVFTLFPTFIEAIVVTGIFVKLGTPWIAVTTMVTVCAYFAFTFSMTNWRIKFRRDLIDTDNKLSEQAVDALINYETVKMFGMEQEESDTYSGLQKAYQDAYLWFRMTLNSLNFGQTTIQAFGLGSAMVLAAVSAANGKLTPGDFVLVNTYVSQLFQPLFDQPDAKPLIMTNDDVVAGRVGEVRFDNVCFKYQGAERGSSGGLRNISFRIPPGKMLAFVGASGAGKSTIIRLLLRFYDVDSGAVLIDGKDVKTFSQATLRKQIGVVAQDTVLFNQTLRFNISYGKPEAPDAEIFEAARSAALGDFVEALPLKLDTTVGERGVRLSGGERQRVGCARCLIKAPAIVLLDEASSALDTHTERAMQANLREVCKNRTTIVIAHRLSTIMMADEIIVLGTDGPDDALGTIIERGSHAQLLEEGGTYAEMWEMQTSVEKEMLSEITQASGPEK